MNHRDFYAGHVVLKGKDRYTVSQVVNAKNVYRGRLLNKTDVVIKSLGHNYELRELDARICGLPPNAGAADCVPAALPRAN